MHGNDNKTDEPTPDLINLDFQPVFAGGPDAGFILTLKGQILAANRVAITRYGYSHDELRQMNVAELAIPELRDAVPKKFTGLKESGDIFEWQHRCKDGSELPVEIVAQPIVHQGKRVVLACVRDISVRKRADILRHGQAEVLEMIATGAKLSETLSLLVRIIESQYPELLGSILLLDEDGIHVRHGAAANLPAAFVAAVEGQAIGPLAGSCGTAMYRKKAVYVEDIAVDPLWVNYKSTALAHGLRACWSEPILDAYGKVLGSFALYHRQPCLPTPAHLQLMEDMGHIAAIAISHHYSAAVLSQSNERLRRLIDGVGPTMFMGLLTPEGVVIEANQSALSAGGLTADQVLGLPVETTFWWSYDDQVAKQLRTAIELCAQGQGSRYDVKIRAAENQYIYLDFSLHPLFDENGNIEFLVPSGNVITERKLAVDLLDGQKRVFEMIAAGSPLVETLSALLLLIEAQAPQMLASVLLLNDDATELLHFAGPSLPPELIVLQSAQAIGPDAGCSGTAVYLKEPVYVEDINRDLPTEEYRAIVRSLGLRACWSTPILDAKVRVLGTFTMFCRELGRPSVEHQHLIDIAMYLATIAISRHNEEDVLRKSEARYRQLFENAPDGILIADNETRYIDVNVSACKMFGYSHDEFIKLQAADIVLVEDVANLDPALEAMKAQPSYREEWRFQRKDGSVFAAEVTAAMMSDGNILGVIRDITERKQNEKQIQYLANYDALTGLPNRAQLDGHLTYAISLARRHKAHLALMFIDLDRFKDINDSLGHSVGDVFLVEVAKRLQLVLRDEDTASRLGGDEFILMLPNSSAKGAALVAEKLLEIISKPYQIDQYDLVVSASIGIALYPADGFDLETLSKSADTAMYQAKQQGRNDYRFFTEKMQSQVTRNMRLVNALRHALEKGQLHVHYQPQISMFDGRLLGVEALLRWQHPDLGNVSPAEFIPVAEESGLILPIGEWVLRTAVQQLKTWMNAGHKPMMMAVNLSAIQFRHPSLAKMITHILDEVQLSPEYLELELTEGVAMYDPIAAIEVMDTLHELGIRMSIDDFGTGYSSLNYLKKFKVYKLKIDQSFVRDISTDQEDRAIVAAIISMSKNLGLHTIAEGVEAVGQYEYLCEQGCDEAQGYYFSKPLPAEQIEQLFLTTKKLVTCKICGESSSPDQDQSRLLILLPMTSWLKITLAVSDSAQAMP